MRKHYQYLKYLLRHKYYVFTQGAWDVWISASCQPWYKAGLSRYLYFFFRLIIHDWSKFTPKEWLAYVNFFYGTRNSNTEYAFNKAWNHHQKLNKHHWQYWVLHGDNGIVQPLKMPDIYILEMVADWCGAGLAITGKKDIETWYNKNKHVIILEEGTRKKVEDLIMVISIDISKELKEWERLDEALRGLGNKKNGNQ